MAKKKTKRKKAIKKQNKPAFKLKKNVRLKSLNPAHVPRVRKELLDADYLKQLSKEELLWYAQFTDEWVGANIHKTKTGKVKSGFLHNTKELAKDCYDRNNRRNNDIYAVSKANMLLSDIEIITEDQASMHNSNPWEVENHLITDIILNEVEESYLSFEEFLELKHSMTKEMVKFYESFYKEQLKNLAKNT